MPPEIRLETIHHEARESNRRYRQTEPWFFRYSSLLYCVFFFLEPYYRHSVAHWIGFGTFFVCFLALYFGIERTEDGRQHVLLAIMFALCLGYLWRNPVFWGATIFPIVIAGYMVPRMLAFLGILGGVCAAMLLQRWHLGLEFWPVFLIASIGISNLAFGREQRHNRAMKRAQHEIEHLAATAERERIARDLHDLLGHTLTLITLKAELANRILPIDPQRAQQEMRDVETTARKALAEVREAVLGVGAVNFASEVARAQTAFAAAEIEAEIHFDDVVLSTQMEQVLCLALREAVTNILRHAAARSVTIALLKRDGTVHLSVADDGCGSACTAGNGLRGMRERVSSLAGSMQFTSSVGEGSRLEIALPATENFAASLESVEPVLPASVPA